MTAGGLLFVASTDDNRFRAFDAKTGKQLWVTKLERRGNATRSPTEAATASNTWRWLPLTPWWCTRCRDALGDTTQPDTRPTAAETSRWAEKASNLERELCPLTQFSVFSSAGFSTLESVLATAAERPPAEPSFHFYSTP